MVGWPASGGSVVDGFNKTMLVNVDCSDLLTVYLYFY